jgi:hypothetical protein
VGSKTDISILAEERQSKFLRVRLSKKRKISAGVRDFSLLQNVQSVLGPTQPSTLWMLMFFPGGRRPLSI